MSGPFDVTLKHLIERYPADWLALCGCASAPVQVIDADLATVAAAADKVVHVLDQPPWLLHLELQSSHDADLPERMQWYNSLLRHRHGERVRSLLVLLRRAADSPRLTGEYREAFPNEEPYLVFRYHLLRVWQIPAERFLSGGLGTLPLAPLADVPETDLPSVVQRLESRVQSEAPADANQLLVSAHILSGLRLPAEAARVLFQGVTRMRESSTYQAILEEGKAEGKVEGKAEGKAEGKVEGKAEGRAEEARSFLLRLGQKRLGAPSTEIRTALDGMSDVDELERLGERLLDVSNWDELLGKRAP